MFQVLFQNATHATIVWFGDPLVEQAVTLEELRDIQTLHNEFVPEVNPGWFDPAGTWEEPEDEEGE